MATRRYSRRVDAWYWIEVRCGRLWTWACPDDEVSCWLDWLPAWAYRRRKAAERNDPYIRARERRCPFYSPHDGGTCFHDRGHRGPHDARATGSMALSGTLNRWSV